MLIKSQQKRKSTLNYVLLWIFLCYLPIHIDILSRADTMWGHFMLQLVGAKANRTFSLPGFPTTPVNNGHRCRTRKLCNNTFHKPKAFLPAHDKILLFRSYGMGLHLTLLESCSSFPQNTRPSGVCVCFTNCVRKSVERTYSRPVTLLPSV